MNNKRIKFLSVIKNDNISEVRFCCVLGVFGVYKKYKNENEECNIITRLQYDNIVKLLYRGNDYFITKCYEGDLSSKTFDNNILQSSHMQMINALTKLQKNSVAHLDIHSKNIFWTKTSKSEIDGIKTYGFLFVLGDFEVAKTTFRDSNKIIVKDQYLLFDGNTKSKNSIPIDFHTDLLDLKRCYFYKDFQQTRYFDMFLRNFTTFSFLEPFITVRKELFLAEELLRLITCAYKEKII
jgi:hypothetical protein